MTVRDILLLGNPKLYDVSEPVDRAELDQIDDIVRDLHDTMQDFRARYGAGRAIAAPQIGCMKRLIYLHIDRPVVFLNPALQNMSKEMMTVWDDCMCFPELLVKVMRHKTGTIVYRDMQWQEKELPLTGDLSELLQHEYDHLDGILAVSRAMDERAFALRSQRDHLE